MAFIVKNINRAFGDTGPQVALLEQYVQTSQPTVALPATTTGQVFRVLGGAVLVKGLLGRVTVATGATATNLKVSSKQLTSASVAVGTAVDIAANVSVASLEVGSFIWVEGDGTAAVTANAGCSLVGSNTGYWIAPQGEIYLTTSATNTGSVKWDIWWQPLDGGAYVVPATLTSSLLTAAI